MSDHCATCKAPEVPANTPRTVYACGASSDDGAPGTFTRCPKGVCGGCPHHDFDARGSFCAHPGAPKPSGVRADAPPPAWCPVSDVRDHLRSALAASPAALGAAEVCKAARER